MFEKEEEMIYRDRCWFCDYKHPIPNGIPLPLYLLGMKICTRLGMVKTLVHVYGMHGNVVWSCIDCSRKNKEPVIKAHMNSGPDKPKWSESTSFISKIDTREFSVGSKKIVKFDLPAETDKNPPTICEPGSKGWSGDRKTGEIK